MGGLASLFQELFNFKEEKAIAMVGLDAAGKTTILNNLKLGEVLATIPTIGFNVETVKYGKTDLTVWDIGGQEKLRPLWRHYYTNTNGTIFVVDSNDYDRLDGNGYSDDNALYELQSLLRENELKGKPILILANKQDLPNALSVDEISKRLKLNKIKDREWRIQGCCATTGDGLYKGLDWLTKTMKESKN